jgi:hypothetical protein
MILVIVFLARAIGHRQYAIAPYFRQGLKVASPTPPWNQFHGS